MIELRNPILRYGTWQIFFQTILKTFQFWTKRKIIGDSNLKVSEKCRLSTDLRFEGFKRKSGLFKS